MASQIDIAQRLLPAAWRGIEFQCGPWSFGFDQGHAEHLYPDRDAGFVESTGRNLARYTFTAYFRNGIAGEKDLLFPTRWQKFVGACADRTSGTLNQPALGNLKVKCVSCNTTFDPNRRDGVDVEVVFVETTDAEDELAKLLASASPLAVALSAAGDLDAECADINPAPEYPEALSPSAFETMKGLSGMVDMFKRGIGNVGSAFDSTLGALDDFSRTLSSNTDDPNVARAIRSLNRAFDAVLQASQVVTSKGKEITQATVQADSTLDAVASFFGMSVDDLTRLNPRLAVSSTVPRGTKVFLFT